MGKPRRTDTPATNVRQMGFDADVFVLSTPGNVSKTDSINVIFIRNGHDVLIVDTGLASDDTALATIRIVEAIGGTLGRTQVLLTHRHVDHYGNVAALWSRGVKVIAGKGYRPGCTTGRRFLALCGCAQAVKLEQAYDGMVHLTEMDLPPDNVEYVGDGDCIRVGSRSFSVISLSAHAHEHIGLFDSETGLLLPADQTIPGTITAALSVCLDEHVLQRTFECVDDLESLGARYLIANHNRPAVGSDAVRQVYSFIRSGYHMIIDRVDKVLLGNDRSMSVYEVAFSCRGFMSERFEEADPHLQIVRLEKMLCYLEYLHDIGAAERMIDAFGAVRYRALPKGGGPACICGMQAG